MSNNYKNTVEYILQNEEILGANEINIDKDMIKKIITKKKSDELVISIIGSMKSGKSTFINALIGSDLMPSENEACTLTTTEIKHSDNLNNKIIKRYLSGKEEIISGKDCAKKFHEEVKNSRKVKSKEEFIYRVEKKVEAINDLSNKTGFCIVDTPGPNEMNGLGVDSEMIKHIFDEQLKKSDYIVYIFDYKYYKSQENIEILERIKKIRPDLMEKNKISFVVNKIDLIGYKDNDVNEVIDEIKKMLDTFGIKERRIFNVSAKKALISRLIKNNENLDVHLEEIEKFTPIIEKEIEGEIYQVKMKQNDMVKLLIEESNITNFEKEILLKLFIQREEEAKNSINDMQMKIVQDLNRQIQSVLKVKEEEIKCLKDKTNKIENKRQKIMDSAEKFKQSKKIIIEKLVCPSYEEAKKKEFYKETYVPSAYVYPGCEYDEYYGSDSGARSAARSKFNTWKNSMRINFEDIYSIYSDKLTYKENSENYFYDTNLTISNELEKLSKIIDELEIVFKKYNNRKIVPSINIRPVSIMSLNYENSREFLSDMYDNSQFIDIDYEERYVSGFFGDKLKNVTTYDISDAMRNEEDDVLNAINSCSSLFFRDYYEKKYNLYLNKVKEIAKEEVKKAADFINYLSKEVNKELEKVDSKKLIDINNDIYKLKEIRINILA